MQTMKIHMRGPKTESAVRSSKISVFLKLKTWRKDGDRSNNWRDNSWEFSETVERYLSTDSRSLFQNSLQKKKKRKKEKKPSPRYIIVKLQRTKDIEKNLKSSQREKKRWLLLISWQEKWNSIFIIFLGQKPIDFYTQLKHLSRKVKQRHFHKTIHLNYEFISSGTLLKIVHLELSKCAHVLFHCIHFPVSDALSCYGFPTRPILRAFWSRK